MSCPGHLEPSREAARPIDEQRCKARTLQPRGCKPFALVASRSPKEGALESITVPITNLNAR